MSRRVEGVRERASPKNKSKSQKLLKVPEMVESHKDPLEGEPPVTTLKTRIAVQCEVNQLDTPQTSIVAQASPPRVPATTSTSGVTLSTNLYKL